MSIYGYARVSDSSQARSGLGLAAQRASIRRYCRDRRWRLTALFVDRAVPGTRALRRRPEGSALTTMVRAGDHVVIPKLDRAWRSVRDCAETLDGWRQRGVHAHLLDVGISTTTPAGELVVGVMAAIAQWEARRIGERSAEAKAVLRAQHRRTNQQVWIGWCLGRDGRLWPCALERQMAARINRARQRGSTWSAIATRLNDDGQRWRGRPWRPQTCARLAARARRQWRVRA
jgi:DNA invertase Pin-like site-specific DNA recombinase